MKQFKEAFQTWLLSHVNDCAAALGIMPGQCVTAKDFDFNHFKLKENATDIITFEYGSYIASFPVCRVFNVLFYQLGYKKEIIIKQNLNNIEFNKIVADIDIQLPDLTKLKSCFSDYSEVYNCVHIDLLNGGVVASNRQTIRYYFAPILSVNKRDFDYATINKKDITALSGQKVRVIVDENSYNHYTTYVVTEDGNIYINSIVGRSFDFRYLFKCVAYNPDDVIILDKSGYKQLLITKPASKSKFVQKMVSMCCQCGTITAKYQDANTLETVERTITAVNNPSVHFDGEIEINNLVSLKDFQADKLYFSNRGWLLATNKDGIFVSITNGSSDTAAINRADSLIKAVSGEDVIKVIETITTFAEVATIALKRAEVLDKANELRQLAQDAGINLSDLFPELAQVKQEQEPTSSANCTNDANLPQNDKRVKARVRRWHRHRQLQRIRQILARRKVARTCSSRISHFVVENAVIAPIVKTAPRPPTMKTPCRLI
jgi:hypothetical protein